MSTNIAAVVARTTAMLSATGFVAVGLAVPASAEVINREVGVANCPPPQSQLCIPIAAYRVSTQGPLVAQFTASPNHCSDIIAKIMVNGTEHGRQRLAPGQRDGSYYMDLHPGAHSIGVQAEGIKGGCNTGYLQSWKGNLRVETNDDAKNGIG